MIEESEEPKRKGRKSVYKIYHEPSEEKEETYNFRKKK